MSAAEQLVALGSARLDQAALVDERVKNWEDKVLSDVLVMASNTGCILGQIFGDYGIGLDALGLNRFEAEEHGFTSLRGHPIDFAALDVAWRAELARRGAE